MTVLVREEGPGDGWNLSVGGFLCRTLPFLLGKVEGRKTLEVFDEKKRKGPENFPGAVRLEGKPVSEKVEGRFDDLLGKSSMALFQRDVPVANDNLGKTSLGRENPDSRSCQKVPGLSGKRPEAVAQLFLDPGDGIHRISMSETPVKVNSFGGMAKIVLGNPGLGLPLHPGRLLSGRRGCFGGEAGHGLLHHFKVEVKPHHGHLSGLLVAQEASGSTNFEIPHGNLVAGSQP